MICLNGCGLQTAHISVSAHFFTFLSNTLVHFFTVILSQCQRILTYLHCRAFSISLISILAGPTRVCICFFVIWTDCSSPLAFLKGLTHMLPLSSPRLHGFCGWVRVGGCPRDSSSIRRGSPLGRGFVCGLCSAGLPCCQVCIWVVSVVRPLPPPSPYDLVDFSLVSAV
jgi:hypothetical protein